MKFPAEHFQAANVIAMFMSEEDAIELRGSDSALPEAKNELARAQAPIDQKTAMIGRDERAISRAAAAEHRQSEHASISSGRRRVSQIGNGMHKKKARLLWHASVAPNAPEAPSTKIQAPKKHQYPNIKSQGQAWSLMLGVSLELEVWNLELP